MSRVQGTLKTDEEEEKDDKRVNGVGQPASSVSTSRALLLPEASEFENWTTSYDMIFSNNDSSCRTGGNPAAFLEHLLRESSGSAVMLVCYFLVLLRLRKQ